ncbi:MAG: lipopolysaccharide biosynthesis protein [Acetobacteraceae bacterium]|nr:lipopolysaccharide biosynthesis protein [Acetobacteraceae bacterium]
MPRPPRPDLDPGRPAPSLSVRTATGAGWIIVWRMSTRILGIISTIVLVRVLAPADFGLVALATTFAQAIDWIATIGVDAALIREPVLDRPLYDTGFTLNLLRGLLMAVAIAAEAYPVAAFFHEPRLATIILVLAFTTFMLAMENIGTVDFRRDLAFQKDFQLSVVPRIASIAASITFALVFANYWALVVGILTNRVLRVAMSYWLHPYRPRLSLQAWRRIFGFSFWTWLCSVTMMVRDRIDAVVIGRVSGAATVGVYSVGWEIGSLTSTELVEPLAAALFAGFSVARRTGADLASGYFKAISATFLLTLPLGVGLSMLAAPVIHLAFGTRWMAAAPLVQVFALVCMAKVVAYISGVLLNAHGMLKVQFRILLAGLAVRVALLLALVGPFGLMGAAAAATGCIAVEEILFLVVTFRQFRLRPIDLLRGIWRCVLATVAMALVLVAQGIGWAAAPPTAWAACGVIAQGVATGAATYGAVLLAAWWLSGQPRGAETAFLDVIGSTLRHFFRKARRIGA